MKDKKTITFSLFLLIVLFLSIYFINDILFTFSNSNLTKLNVEFVMTTGTVWKIKKPTLELKEFLLSKYTNDYSQYNHFPVEIKNEPPTYSKETHMVSTGFIVYGYFTDSLADYSVTNEGFIPIFHVTKYKKLKWE